MLTETCYPLYSDKEEEEARPSIYPCVCFIYFNLKLKQNYNISSQGFFSH